MEVFLSIIHSIHSLVDSYNLQHLDTKVLADTTKKWRKRETAGGPELTEGPDEFQKMKKKKFFYNLPNSLFFLSFENSKRS